MNLIPEVVKMLGLIIGEGFTVIHKDQPNLYEGTVFQFTENDLQFKDGDGFHSTYLLSDLIRDKAVAVPMRVNESNENKSTNKKEEKRKNLFHFIVKELGLEFGEEFRLKSGNLSYCTYVFKEDGLYNCTDTNIVSQSLFNALLSGKVGIVAEPFCPKYGEVYFYVEWFVKCESGEIETKGYESPIINNAVWQNLEVDFAHKYVGNCFRSENRAEMEKYNVFKKLYGKSWEDVLKGRR